MTVSEVPFYDCIVLNGTVVTAADVGRYDLAIKDGKIMLLAPAGHLTKTSATRVIDAEGAYVMVRMQCSVCRVNVVCILTRQ
jgi:dihydroorotase-like cyclic amidohydrolase